MARRASTATEVSLRLDGVVGNNGLALCGPPDILGQSTDNPDIAPWLDIPPTPPPKPTRGFGFAQKNSFSTFTTMGSGSSSRQGSARDIRYPRKSDSHSTLSIPDEKRRSADDDSARTRVDSVASSSTNELKKMKSISVFRGLIPKRSKSRMRPGSGEAEHPSLRPPPLPDTNPFAPGSVPSLVSLSTQNMLRKDKKEKKKKNSASPLPPPPPVPEHDGYVIALDTNLDSMDGIIDLSRQSLGSSAQNHPSSPSSGVISSQSHLSDRSSLHSNHHSYVRFNNPFESTPTLVNHKAVIPSKRISPTTKLSSSNGGIPLPNVPLLGAEQGRPSWTPPESWAVEKDGEDPDEDGGSSSSDESVAGGAPGRRMSTSVLGDTSPNGVVPPPSTHGSHPHHGSKSRKRLKNGGSGKPRPPDTHVRIYRANNTYHIVIVAAKVNVANLTGELNEKLLPGESETHRLYLKERGRERMLAQTERPAVIVRRRLDQAGYDPVDGQELLADNMSFLLKFVYKSQLLGPAEEELMFENFEHVDLTGRSLRTIPVVLHQHADSIISLKLSRNPMIEIPLDFIQACTTLRELRLSNMAMKKVPQSVRHSSTLNRLDLSSNRISDLDEAYLDQISGLTALFVQNNRIEKLPWYFPRFPALVTLNISNNKFHTLPTVICSIESLRDLDVSFNMISELPEELGKLKGLDRLILVGNQVTRFPDECRGLVNLREIDCRRNLICDLNVVSNLPQLQSLSADHNAVHALDLSLGPHLSTLDASHNEITRLSLIPGPVGNSPYALTSLDISYAKLSSLEGIALGRLSSLRHLRLDHNTFRVIPESLGDLTYLQTLSCSDNKLDSIPSSIGRLQRLEVLDAHNNSLTELPQSLWNCASLTKINVTSNLLGIWHDPPPMPLVEPNSQDGGLSSYAIHLGRKTSTMSLGLDRVLPPLVHSLEKLYLGENRLTDDVLHPLMILKELRVLNLSFNEIQDMPSNFFKNLILLEELYLSGNKLASIPTEHLSRLTKLSILYLNGNRLQTLPQELGKVMGLMVLDVGSNLLKYNINNWEFDWNWNFNKNLKYLNLSGNNRLQIRSEPARMEGGHPRPSFSDPKHSLSGFTELTQLRVLGLMDVTIAAPTMNIPDESDDRRVRTSGSMVSGMAYGIADALGKNEYLNMLDLVQEGRGRKDEAIFGMFGRAQPPKSLPPGASPNRLARYLRDHFVGVLDEQLSKLSPSAPHLGGIPDALRRTFLKLNQDLHDSLFFSSRKMSTVSASGGNHIPADPATLRSGASGIVLYFVRKTLYVANAGNALAVVSRQGIAQPVSRKHDPYDRAETARVRAAEGWVSPLGLVNDEVDISRAFGFYHLLPIINARPDVTTYNLTPQDEFVIVANRGLWDYVSYQTAVDIARAERADPMIAAQKLRDFAISYGAQGSTMIMVISVAEIPEIGLPKKRNQILDRMISRLEGEVPAPVGHIALVFSDIRNSTHLWEVNPGMATAHRLHNTLLRRQLRFCGGYEVKTEGDSFMCSFPTALAAVWWCVTVQYQLLHEAWPLEILECEDGKPIYDPQNRLIARGLSVRMGIHCGSPSPEPDPITHRMDYFGPMVNRSARVCGSAAGGQIMCSAEIIREINASIFKSEPETEHSKSQPPQAIEAIREMGIVVAPVGDVKLKGLEVPEHLSLLYPAELVGRQQLEGGVSGPPASGSRVPFSVTQMRDLGVLCLRLETLTSDRIFRPIPERKGSIHTVATEDPPAQSLKVLRGDPQVLLPLMNEQSTDADLMMLLDSLSVRIGNAASTLERMYSPQSGSSGLSQEKIHSILSQDDEVDERTLQHILSLLRSI